MADWMTIRVVLQGRDGEPLPAPPGRVLLAATDHTLADLAGAIDRAFGRWDLTPPHRFGLGNRTIEGGEDAGVPLAELAAAGPARYVVDGGVGWLHDLEVEDVGVDPGEGGIVPVFGWGTIPDQYGRETEDDDVTAVDVVDLDADAPPGELDWDDEAELAAWDEARGDAWQVVEEAVAEVDRRVPDDELRRAVAALRDGAGDPARRLLFDAADLDALPDDDAALWTALAAAVVEPQGEPEIPADVEAAWAALEPADWAGAVIELVRAGIGQPAEPDDLIALIERCPEIEGPELSDDDVEVLATAFGTVVELWAALGAVDADHRLTALGRWGLPEALRLAWAESAAVART